MSEENARRKAHVSAHTDGPDGAPKQEKLASELVCRCHVLLDELERFQIYVSNERDFKFKSVELGRFKHDVLTECKVLEKVCG